MLVDVSTTRHHIMSRFCLFLCFISSSSEYWLGYWSCFLVADRFYASKAEEAISNSNLRPWLEKGSVQDQEAFVTLTLTDKYNSSAWWQYWTCSQSINWFPISVPHLWRLIQRPTSTLTLFSNQTTEHLQTTSREIKPFTAPDCK